MKYTHVEDQKPKAANKRESKDRDALGDVVCLCASLKSFTSEVCEMYDYCKGHNIKQAQVCFKMPLQ